MDGEYRWDPISDRWVIIAPGRAARPDHFQEGVMARQIVAPCPFCRGHEAQTPQPVAVYPPGAAEWQVRVVPNLFPAVAMEWSSAGPSSSAVRPAVGVHEVIIEAPHHVVSLAQLSDEQVSWTFASYRDRLAELGRDSRLAYGAIFKNARAGGGASLEHVHSQLIATAQTPESIAQEMRRLMDHWQARQRCLLCELLAAEVQQSRRVVLDRDGFVAFCPFASRFPYETWLVPQAHAADFTAATPSQLESCGWLMRDLIRRLEASLPEPAYNFWLHTVPFHRRDGAAFHWHFELAPRLTRLAGFELGSGSFINPVSPEKAAQVLRQVR
jgi:UDPglucose--hexose-1-phosphate uridylyltransferase